MATSDHPLVLDLGSVRGPAGPSAFDVWRAIPGNENKTVDEFIAAITGPNTFFTEPLLNENGYVPVGHDDSPDGAVCISPVGGSGNYGVRRIAIKQQTGWAPIPPFLILDEISTTVGIDEDATVTYSTGTKIVVRSGNVATIIVDLTDGYFTFGIGASPFFVPEKFRPRYGTRGVASGVIDGHAGFFVCGIDTTGIIYIDSPLICDDRSISTGQCTKVLINFSYLCEVG